MTIHTVIKNNDLQKLSSSLNSVQEFAIDLEFDRNRYRYGFNICLMQIYDGQDCYLVDPLSNDLDIKHIFSPIENPEVEKVVFAFGEDLRLLHSMGCFPKNLYDLDAATSLLNYEPASLTNLIKEVLDVEVNSSSQQSNWYRRPLSENQKLYAADDVLYLLDFKKNLQQQAKEKGFLEWVEQENALFDMLDYSGEDHNNLIKDKDKKDLTVFEWAIYIDLMNFFDEAAQKYNKPVYQIINKKLIAGLAQNPNKVHKWEQTKGIFGHLKNSGFKAELKKVLDESRKSAEKQGLSKNRKASDNLSQEEYQAMRSEQQRVNTLKGQLFDPIQKRISEDFGQYAKSYILPNRLAKELITGENEPLPAYKKELFKKYATKLNLDMNGILP